MLFSVICNASIAPVMSRVSFSFVIILVLMKMFLANIRETMKSNLSTRDRRPDVTEPLLLIQDELSSVFLRDSLTVKHCQLLEVDPSVPCTVSYLH